VALGAAPAAAQQTGSIGIDGGVTVSGPGLAGRANLLAHFGSFSVGPEVGASVLGNAADVWHGGGALRLTATARRIRPYGTAGVAYYSWNRCAQCARLTLLGVSLGAGMWLAHPAPRLSLGLEMRWHRQLQRLGTPQEMSFVTVTLGLALHW
jgi:hypothetical protein